MRELPNRKALSKNELLMVYVVIKLNFIATISKNLLNQGLAPVVINSCREFKLSYFFVDKGEEYYG